MAKVVGVDSFCTELVNDVLVAEGLTECEAEAMADELNAKYCSRGDEPVWHKAFKDSYKLFEVDY